MLEEKGYTVSSISTYNDEQQPHTRIVVYKEGLGYDLKEEFYNDAEIIVDPEMLSGDTDILVILGTGETEEEQTDNSTEEY